MLVRNGVSSTFNSLDNLVILFYNFLKLINPIIFSYYFLKGIFPIIFPYNFPIWNNLFWILFWISFEIKESCKIINTITNYRIFILNNLIFLSNETSRCSFLEQRTYIRKAVGFTTNTINDVCTLTS